VEKHGTHGVASNGPKEHQRREDEEEDGQIVTLLPAYVLLVRVKIGPSVQVAKRTKINPLWLVIFFSLFSFLRFLEWVLPEAMPKF
jgi:hypothetical protein